MPSFDDHVTAQQLADLPGSGEEWIDAAWAMLREWLIARDDTTSHHEWVPWLLTLQALAHFPKNQVWVDAVARLLSKQREVGARIL